MQRVQLQTSDPVETSARRSYFVESSATKKPSCREFNYKQVTLQKHQLEEVTLQRVQLQRNHHVESSATVQTNPVEISARRSHLVESSATMKPSCREFSYKQVTLYRDQLGEVTLQRVQLQTIHPCTEISLKKFFVESSATNKLPCRKISQNKSPCREFCYKETTMQRVQLQTSDRVETSARRSYLVESSATKKPSCREFNYKQVTLQRHQLEEVTLQRVQLRRNHHVESSATNKSPCRNIARISRLVESSVTKKPPCREFGYKPVTLQKIQLQIALQICDRISYNKASTHTKSNLRFYQKWIAGLIHYHISHCTSFSTGKSGFCSSFLPTLSKPRVGDWHH